MEAAATGRGEKKAKIFSGGAPSSAWMTAAISSGASGGTSAWSRASVDWNSWREDAGITPSTSTKERIWPTFMTAPFMSPRTSA